MARWYILGLLILLGLCSACAGAGTKMYRRILKSDLGLGLALEQSPEQVHEVLGQPTAQITRQDGNVVEEFYLPADMTSTDATTPQLSLTFAGRKLIRLYNYYAPTDEKQAGPPFFFEPLPGVKLGNRRSDLVKALGKPTTQIQGEEWRFTLPSGRQVAILARFTEIPEIKEEWCTQLSLTLSDQVAQGRGEYYDKTQQAMDEARGKGKPNDIVPKKQEPPSGK